MNKIYFILICTCISLASFSCDDDSIDLDASTKYHVYGQVTGDLGVPLEGIEVNLVDYGGRFISFGTIDFVQPQHLVVQCMLTNAEGEYDFITSDASGSATALQVNRLDTDRLSNVCHVDRMAHLQCKTELYRDVDYENFEMKLDVELRPSVLLTVVNNIDYEDRFETMDFHIEHEGNFDPDIRIWESLLQRDSVVMNIVPDQTVVLRTLERPDRMIIISNQDLTINLHN